MGKSEIEMSSDRLRITRIYDAPRELVFEAWKRADLVEQWWGCAQTTKVESQIDFRVGGVYNHKMHIQGVGEMTYTSTFDEIVEPGRIAYSAAFGPIQVHVTVEFFEIGERTRLVVTQEGFPSLELCKNVSQGLTPSLDKLENLLLAPAA